MKAAETKWLSYVSGGFKNRHEFRGASRIVLIGEDESKSVRLFCLNVCYETCRVRVAKDWKSGLVLADKEKPDVVLLDAAPFSIEDQDAVTQFCRQSADTLVIVLTAGALGGHSPLRSYFRNDGFPGSPSGPFEPVAAIDLGRNGQGRLDHYSFGDVKVDFTSLEVAKGGQSLALSPREFQILCYMIQNRKRVISRSELLERVWGYHNGAHTRTVDSHICNLRQKLEDKASAPVYIHTVHRVGYRFTG